MCVPLGVWKRALRLLKAARKLAAFSLSKPSIRNIAVFIDGSNLVSNLQERGWPSFIDLEYLANNIVDKDRLVSLLYTFSSPHPIKVPEAIRLEQQRYHDTLRTLSSIILGEGWRPPPNYEEKACDVILAINLVLMARNNKYDIAYLITGDSDLAPAVQMVRQIGKEVVLVYFWDKYLPKDKRRFSYRLARVATSKIGFKKKWAKSLLDSYA